MSELKERSDLNKSRKSVPSLLNAATRKKASEEEIKEFHTWIQSHPTLQLKLPDFQSNGAGWNSQRTNGVEYQIPRMFTVLNRQYTRLPRFPYSNEVFFAGGHGLVCAYQCENDKTIGALKIEIVEPDEPLESEAFSIVEFMKEHHLFGSDSAPQCGNHFIKLTAAASEMVPIGEKQQKQSFHLLEYMEMNLQIFRLRRPELFLNPDPLRFLFRSIAQGIACLHHSKPVPVVHGDLKPENLLCSPYSEHWLESFHAYDPQLLKEPQAVYVKLTDFAVSFLRIWETKRLVYTLGTLVNFSPERLASSVPTRADDIWAFGLIMAQLATRSIGSFQSMIKPKDWVKHAQQKNVALWKSYSKEQAKNEVQAIITNQMIALVINPILQQVKAVLSVRDENIWSGADQAAFLDLIRGCLDPRASEHTDSRTAQRLDIDGVLNHRFLKINSVSFHNVFNQQVHSQCHGLKEAFEQKEKTLQHEILAERTEKELLITKIRQSESKSQVIDLRSESIDEESEIVSTKRKLKKRKKSHYNSLAHRS
jgi:serine/threonine protein kinase